MEHCSDAIIDNNYLENGGDNGIYYAFSRNAVISNNVLRNCGGSGSITIGYSDNTIAAQGIMVIGNTIYADASAPLPTITWTYGIDAVYCERCSIVGNIMYNTADAVVGRLMKGGIALEEHQVRDVLVIGNKITNVPEEGIRLGVVNDTGWHLSNITISDNEIFGCRTAIEVDLTINSLISNNRTSNLI
jgi:parallel beta-helix repeat protein